MQYEYKVVPAPRRGVKAKGVKSNEERFAFAIETVMNDLAKDGWDYVRTDILPAEEREGLMGKTTVFQNLMVFRRGLETALEAPTVAAAFAEPEIENPQPQEPIDETPPSPAPERVEPVLAQPQPSVARSGSDIES